jgi:hypothetical protein
MQSAINSQPNAGSNRNLRRCNVATKIKAPRRPSWLCLDLAFKIQTSDFTTKLVLLYLAKSVNESLSCYPSYATIMKYTGIRSRSTVSEGIQYLRNTLKVMRWKSNGKSNVYMFDLKMMRSVVKDQAVFTEVTSPMNGPVSGPTAVRGDSPVDGLGEPPATQATSPTASASSPSVEAASPTAVHKRSTNQRSEEERSKTHNIESSDVGTSRRESDAVAAKIRAELRETAHA